jgi:hypothetical protein
VYTDRNCFRRDFSLLKLYPTIKATYMQSYKMLLIDFNSIMIASFMCVCLYTSAFAIIQQRHSKHYLNTHDI